MSLPKKDLRRARVLAMQVLYSSERNPEISMESVFESIAAVPEALVASNDARKFAKTIVLSFRTNQEEIDRILSKHMKNWELSRLGAIDRAILRISMAELLEVKTALPVVISEAVDIAKQYGTDESGKFINGVLDATKKDIDYAE